MKLLRDTWIVFVRYVQILVGNPAWIVIGVVQPLLYLLLFAPLLKSIASMPGFPPGGAYNVFVPGLLILVVLAIPFGLDLHPLGLVIALLLVALIGLAISSIAYTLALWLRSEDSY